MNAIIERINSLRKKVKFRKIWIAPGVVILLVVGGLIYYSVSRQATTTTSETKEAPLQTAIARRGSIIISTTGSGTLVVSQQFNLSFPASGTVGKVNVQAGDVVKKGDALAELSDQDTLQAALETAENELATAQKELDTFKDSAMSALGQAELDFADAQEAYVDAKAALRTKGEQRCDDDTLALYYENYIQAQEAYDRVSELRPSMEVYLADILPAKQDRDEAYMTYKYCAEYTDYEILSSQAEVKLTESAMNDAEKTLEILRKNNGLDPDGLAEAQNKVDVAQAALQTAKENLEGATLIAPIDGTILSVAGLVGDKVGTETFISIADLTHPYVEFAVDETEIEKVAVGDEATVVFDAIPSITYTGKIIRLEPELVEVSGYKALQGLLQLEVDSESKGTPAASEKATTTPDSESQLFRVGMNASIEIVSGQAENAVLVPVEALRDLGNEEYGVFVVSGGGEPRLRTVEVGLMDVTYAEIKSGLEAGETVTTGIVEIKQQ